MSTPHTEAIARAQAANEELLATRVDRWYPTFHLAAAAGWINDPNGLVHAAGRHQVFFQHHPADATWGPMHWGHASSEDLVTWRREPIALAPSLSEDADGIFSGSAVVTEDGTLRAYYTGNRWRNGRDDSDGVLQVQMLAESTDGVTFTPRGVVVETPDDVLDFRDPKVWKEDGTWYMVIGAQSAEHRGQVRQYRSSDGLTWQADGILYEDPDESVYMLECPDLFPLGDHWVLLYGPMTTAAPQGFAGRNGHNAGYVIGDRTAGGGFTPLTDYRPADWGHTFYAPQTYLAPDGRRLMLGWMGGFDRPLASALTDGWSGQLTVPRELTLGEDLRLRQRPIPELDRLGAGTVDHGAFTLEADEERILLEDADAYEILLEAEPGTAEQLGLLVHRVGESGGTWVSYDDQSGRLVLDRRTSTGGPGDRGVRSAPVDDPSRLQLRVLVDRGSVEVFVGDGEAVLSSLAFPADGPRSLSLRADGGRAQVHSCVVRRMRGIWESPDR